MFNRDVWEPEYQSHPGCLFARVAASLSFGIGVGLGPGTGYLKCIEVLCLFSESLKR